MEVHPPHSPVPLTPPLSDRGDSPPVIPPSATAGSRDADGPTPPRAGAANGSGPAAGAANGTGPAAGAANGTVPTAGAANGTVPAEERWQVRLPPDPATPGRARNLVADACAAWHLPDLLYPARAIVSELVTNAVEHAGTEIDFTVSLRGSSLHVAVRDGSPVPPSLLELTFPEPGRPLNDRGYGLRVVEADSTAWGTVPAVDGKVVWATIRARDSRSRTW